jgi:hypothetical protein
MAMRCLTKWFMTLGCLTFSMSVPCEARTSDPYHLKTFDVSGSRYFSNYDAVVVRYLRQESPRRQSSACIVGLSVFGKRDQAWVIWHGGGRLILWEGGGENDLNRSRRNLSLRRDVVASDAATGTSTYLVSRPWVAALERACARSGRRIIANPYAKKKGRK